MNRGAYESDVHIARRQAAAWRLAGLGLVAVTLLQTTLLFFQDRTERTWFLPANVTKTFWIEGGSAAPEYLEQMALYAVKLALDATPSSVDQNAEVLLRLVIPEATGAMRTALALEARRIKEASVSTVFYPMSTEVGADREVAVKGEFVTIVGEKPITRVHRAYRIRFQDQNGRLAVAAMKEVNYDRPFERTAAENATASKPSASEEALGDDALGVTGPGPAG